MSSVKATLKDLFLIRPARVRPWAGIRMVLVIVVPCVVVYSLFLWGVIPVGTGLPTPANTWFNILSWIVIGSLMTGLVVNDGTGQDQIIRFTAAALAVLVGSFVGSVASLWLVAILLSAFLWGFVSAYSGLLKANDGLLHLAITVPIVVGFTLPVNTADNLFFAGQDPWSVIWSRLGWLFVGVVWSAVVALATRSLQRAGDPATAAVKKYLADVAMAFTSVTTGKEDTHQVTHAIDQTFTSGGVAAESVGSLTLLGDSPRKRRLAVAYSSGERIVRATLGVRRALAHLDPDDPITKQELHPILAATGSVLTRATTGTVDRSEIARIRERIVTAAKQPAAAAPVGHEVLAIILEMTTTILDSIPALAYNQENDAHETLPTVADLGSGPGFWSRVRAELRVTSDIFHHGIRIGVALVVMVIVYTVFDVPLPFFMALAIISTVQPDVGSSMTSALRIALCTVIGSLLAGIVIVAFPNEWAIMIALAVFAFLAFAFSGYAPVVLFSMMTPIFILLFTFNALGDWRFATDRVIDTVIGVVIGLVCVLVFWPRTTTKNWAPTCAKALRSVGDCTKVIFAEYNKDPNQDRQGDIRASLVAALAAHRNLRSLTHMISAQPKTLQTVGPLAIAAESGIADAVDALHLAAAALHVDDKIVELAPAGAVVGDRFGQLATGVDQWHQVPPPDDGFADLYRRVRQEHESPIFSEVTDGSLHILTRSAGRAGRLIDDAVTFAPAGPLTLRNRELHPQVDDG